MALPFVVVVVIVLPELQVLSQPDHGRGLAVAADHAHAHAGRRRRVRHDVRAGGLERNPGSKRGTLLPLYSNDEMVRVT